MHVHNMRRETSFRTLLRRVAGSWQLYVLILPAFLYILIFRYGPMYGLQLAFKSYNVRLGITGSPFVGLEHFRRFLSYYRFGEIFSNTIILGLYKLAVGFPIPILLALSINEVRSPRIKRFLQTVTYAPYFLSVVVVVGIVYQLFSPHYGILSGLIRSLTGKTLNIMGTPEAFRHVFVWTDVWQLMGYQAILYLAALSAVPPELYEAAAIDGASKFQRLLHIDIPSLLPTATVLFILEVSRVMDISFEKVILLQTPLNLRVSEVLTTYVYKVGILEGYFDFATAIGLFNSLINLVLVVTMNTVARKWGESSLW
ncbi:ABC-type transporter, integral membrane subunit [Spirochaeta thermophila DSM 6578]|uniref:ABC-type transporter, integral membrane subunit n=2 Tax=Winmispira thermophila TaxID=154 RepID=G0GFH6_WINT7|nr:ABC-type transporter, integral membrane subunit [Spirochaeta thermophila DSM 6578]